MTDDELVERYFPCTYDNGGCHEDGKYHDEECAAYYRSTAKAIAAAVREAVLKRVRGCRECHGTGTRIRLTNSDPPKCERCHGRGVVEGET